MSVSFLTAAHTHLLLRLVFPPNTGVSLRLLKKAGTASQAQLGSHIHARLVHGQTQKRTSLNRGNVAPIWLQKWDRDLP